MTQMTISSYSKALKKEMDERLETKTSWGKEQVKILFLEAQVAVLSNPENVHEETPLQIINHEKIERDFDRLK